MKTLTLKAGTMSELRKFFSLLPYSEVIEAKKELGPRAAVRLELVTSDMLPAVKPLEDALDVFAKTTALPDPGEDTEKALENQKIVEEEEAKVQTVADTVVSLELSDEKYLLARDVFSAVSPKKIFSTPLAKDVVFFKKESFLEIAKAFELE